MAVHTTIDTNSVTVTSDPGADGTAGTPGFVGGVGGTGGSSDNVWALAPAGSFAFSPSGSWQIQAVTGPGGFGGAGGAGDLVGGLGGAGGASGTARAQLS